jgi:hypothetical protein
MKLLAVADGQVGVSRGVKNTLVPFINDCQVQAASKLQALHSPSVWLLLMTKSFTL